MAVDIDGVNSTISTDKLIPQSGTALQIGESSDVITIPSGATITNSGTANGFGITSSDQSACQAWVNYNQSSSTAIADSYNVSSLTDEGTGDCTISFTSAMGNADYAVAGMTTQRGFCCIETDPLATGSFAVSTRYSDGLSFSDFDQVCVIVFGD